MWHFKKGRAYEAAQSYFRCLDETEWLGLPLMGVPEVGRASHSVLPCTYLHPALSYCRWAVPRTLCLPCTYLHPALSYCRSYTLPYRTVGPTPYPIVL